MSLKVERCCRFEDLLRSLTVERKDICDAMIFALDNADSAFEVCVNLFNGSNFVPKIAHSSEPCLSTLGQKTKRHAVPDKLLRCNLCCRSIISLHCPQDHAYADCGDSDGCSDPVRDAHPDQGGAPLPHLRHPAQQHSACAQRFQIQDSHGSLLARHL